MTKDVSVVIPCFNAEKYISATLGSVFAQNFDSYEVIVVNDGSTDGTGDILDNYKKKFKKLIVYHQANKGVAVAYNLGVKLSNAKYIVRQDADDLMLPNRLAAQYRWMEENSHIDLCGSWMNKFESPSKLSGFVMLPTNIELIRLLICFSNQIANPTTIAKRSILSELDFPVYKIGEDLALLLKIISDGGRIGNMPYSTIGYRVHPAQATSSKNIKEILESANMIYAKFGSDAIAAIGLVEHGALFKKWREKKLTVKELTDFILLNKNLFSSVNKNDAASAAISVFRLYRNCADFKMMLLPLLARKLSFMNLYASVFDYFIIERECMRRSIYG